ncbi:MAG: VacJ family lipoprotein [Gammaproteobacteria bacterium]|nr:VacJ family lipoprotein [Gammaproteobacteria bacterium]
MKNNAVRHKLLPGIVLGTMLAITGCATGPDADPRDPLEEYNRAAHSFNDLLDEAILKPLAGGYAYITPDPVDRGVTNFFDNLRDVRSAINNLLQLKIGRAFSDVGRVAINSTIGILGLMDVASNMNLPSYKEDFGQTLGVWGMDSGPYIVLPLFGPSTARDGVGLVADWYTDPLTYMHDDGWQMGLRGLNIVDTRSDLMNASRVVDQGALDPYAFIRDAYLQRRESLVHDGMPPQ